MKSTKDFRANHHSAANDTTRKAVKLEPIRKSGKEKHEIFKNLKEDNDEEDEIEYKKRESIFDYIGDDEEDEDFDDEIDDENFDDEEDHEDFEDEEG